MEDKDKKTVEEDFIATIKLVTGEEIISNVSYMPDDDSLVLECPMEVSKIETKQKNIHINGFALQEWIASTFDHMFVLPKKHVLTMTEVEDEKIQHFYNDCVTKHMAELHTFRDTFEPRQFSRKMGNLGSIKETKKSLENIFKKS